MPSEQPPRRDGRQGPLSAYERSGRGGQGTPKLPVVPECATLLENSPSGQIFADLGGRILFANAAFAKNTGKAASEVVGCRLQEFLSRGSTIFFETQFLPSLLARGGLTEVSLDLEVNGGDRLPVMVNAGLQLDEYGNAEGILLAVFEATKRRQYERELLRARREADQIAEVVRRSSDAIITFSAERLVQTWNRGAEQLLGYSASEMKGRDILVLVDEQDRAEIEAAVVAMVDGLEFTRDLPATTRTGSSVEISISLTPHLEAPGTLVAFSAIIRDNTSRKNAERALLENMAALSASEQRLRTAAETADLGSWDLDLTTGRMICSDQCKKNFGWPLDQEFNYPDLRAAVHPDDLAMMSEAVQKALDSQSTYRAEYRNIWPDGSTHWVIAAGRAQYSQDGQPVRMTGFTLDVTERHKAQAALLQSEKLAAVGRLAASIAHEINNPLESVMNLLYLASSSEDLGEVRSYLDTADQELRRAAGITSQTLRFHRQSGRAKPVSSEELLAGVASMYNRRFENSNITLLIRLRAQRTVECLDGEIRQVLTNLVGNAVDAMPPEGTLAVRSRDGTHRGTPGVWFTISDSGSGMSRDAQEKLFEAFYTTKGSNGTGLGLWISMQIIERHHGAILFRSSQASKKHGTVFLLFLPFESPMMD